MTGWLVPALLTITVVAAVRGTWSPCGLSMVSAINPMSERSRGYRYWLTTLWFIAGAVLGGALLGLGSAVLAVLLGPLPGRAALPLAAAGCLVALAADLRVAGFHLPLHPRQVNELWLMRYRRWLYAAGFGAQIGAGFATYIMTAATYLVVVLAGLAGSPVLAVAAGLLFGLVRGLAVLLSSRCRTAAGLRRLHARLSSLEPASLRLVMLAELAAAVLLAVATAAVAGLVAAMIGLGLLAGRRLAGRGLAGRGLAGRRPLSVAEPGPARATSPT
ncbi:MAG TPA: hypothetical protein VFU36_03670 [Jatrophihabitans sp.]|nr:hypothetical protein [Jatrophihabitans sp.]